MHIILRAKLQFLAIAVSPTSHSSSRPRISVRPAGAVRTRRMTALLTALFPHDRPALIAARPARCAKIRNCVYEAGPSPPLPAAWRLTHPERPHWTWRRARPTAAHGRLRICVGQRAGPAGGAWGRQERTPGIGGVTRRAHQDESAAGCRE